MTENEAIKELKYIKRRCDDEGRYKDCDALEKAIKALEEIQQYRAIGTIEEFKALKDCGTHDCIIKHLTGECSYKETGCSDCKSKWKIKDLLEKNEPKKPNQVSKAMDKDKFVGLIGRCPNCGSIVAEDNLVCEDCFQALDWSE